MLLSYIKEANEEEYTKEFGREIPSIHKLQSLIEAGWAKGTHLRTPAHCVGIDLEGAAQLRNSLCICGSRFCTNLSGHAQMDWYYRGLHAFDVFRVSVLLP